MRRSLSLLLFVLVSTVCFAQTYTVILKNGKVMKGTFVSETGDAIAFKDEKGFQYSLKKSTLDLEKMEEANRPAEPPAPAVEAPQEETPAPPPQDPVQSKKPARVFTTADVERYKSQQNGMQNAAPAHVVPPASAPVAPAAPEPAVPVNPLQAPEEYLSGLRSSIDLLKQAKDNIQGVAESMMTAFEVASSTGANGQIALQTYLKSDDAQAKLAAFNEVLLKLNAQSSALSQPPGGMEKGHDAFETAYKSLQDMNDLIKTPKITASTAYFKGRVSELSDRISSALETLQAL